MNTSTRSRPISRFAVALVAGLLAAGVLSACTSSNSPEPPSAADTTATTPTTSATTETTTTEAQTTETQTTETQTSTQEASAAGKQVFTQNCGSCHTLKDAGTQGQVGPNLDQLKPDAARVEKQVKSGGAAMPSFKDTLSSAQIKAVAAYVSGAAGS